MNGALSRMDDDIFLQVEERERTNSIDSK